MGKSRRVFVCRECGFESSKWAGRCPGCEQWNTLAEETVAASRSTRLEREHEQPQLLTEVDHSGIGRMSTGSQELDRVLGGGLVPGALVLLGGDPGIGKSTMVLQVAQHVAGGYGTVLYISGEESVYQLKMRAERLRLHGGRLLVSGNPDLERIEEQFKSLRPQLVIIDSIQTTYRSGLPALPGSLAQIRETAAALLRLAKEHGCCVLLVGHVTKEGILAGPRLLEHMVDVVLYFEGDKQFSLRMLRGSKNRFGSTNEVGMFDMQEQGLVDVENPSQWLLAERPRQAMGSVVISVLEGSRPLLVEVQALVAAAGYGQPRRSVTGADYNRVSLVLAVLEKLVGLEIASQDVFVNIVGGIKASEPGADLGIACALASSFRGVPVLDHTVMMGEIGLAGEVRSVNQAGIRVREAQRLGYDRFILPESNLKHIDATQQAGAWGVKTVEQALEILLGGCA